MQALTTFSDPQEFERARAFAERLGIDHLVISPSPAYERVACPAIAFTDEAKAAFVEAGGGAATVGWVDYRAPATAVPATAPAPFAEDLLGRVAIVLLAPCVADPNKLRLIAHFSGDVAEALPYVNAELIKGSYVPRLPVFTYMDGHRMVSLFESRVTVAKADDIVDAWASLERVRCLVNDVWERRASITPSAETRRRPPALEIYKRLPGTNCRVCGEQTCTAFAWAVWRGDVQPHECVPVFSGDRGELKDALLAICEGLGIPDEDAD